MRSRQPLLILAFLASWVACGGDDLVTPTTGELTVAVSTSGEEPDPDGYTLALDGQPWTSIESNGTGTFTVPEGDHTIELGGLAANCSVAGGLARGVRVLADQDNSVSFEVICVSTAGGVRVTTATTGPEPDADGYAVHIDGGDPQTIDINTAVAFTGLAAGDHALELQGIADNCTVAGENPRGVTVVAGEMVETVFEVTCVATLGGITVSTSTTGPGTDNDGYTARVDDGPEQPIGQNGSVALTGIVAGTHSVTLGDVATNCAVEGDNPRSVDVPVGDPVPVAFRVSCTSGRTPVDHDDERDGRRPPRRVGNLGVGHVRRGRAARRPERQRRLRHPAFRRRHVGAAVHRDRPHATRSVGQRGERCLRGGLRFRG